MNLLRPKFGVYLLWWCGIWLLITVGTQLPKGYEYATADAAYYHSSIYRQLFSDTLNIFIGELVCALLWASVSWCLQVLSIYCLRRRPMPTLRYRGKVLSSAIVWPIVFVTLPVAVGLGIILWAPLAGLVALFGNARYDDDPAPGTISNASVMADTIGTFLAFILPPLIAGYMTIRTVVPSMEAQ